MWRRRGPTKAGGTEHRGHDFGNLIGHSDSNAAEDTGQLHVTFHYDWWSTLCIERMPRVRFGRVHSYNNYFNAPGNHYCIRASSSSEVFAVKNVFENISTPYEYYAPDGKILAVGNATINGTAVSSFNDSVFTPPYACTTDETNLVAGMVANNAGAGRLLAGFTASPTTGTAPLTVTFADTSSGLITNRFGNFGDSTAANTAGGASFVHTYAAGAYTVTLTASNSDGTSTLVSNNLITAFTTFQAWQLQYFGCTAVHSRTRQRIPTATA